MHTLLLALILATPNPAGSSAFVDRLILWGDADKTVPVFVPAQLLTSGADVLRELELSKASEAAIRTAAKKALKIDGAYPRCTQPPDGDSPARPEPNARTRGPAASRVHALLGRRTVALLGEVVGLESGFIPGRNYAGTLVRVRVVEIFRDPQSQFAQDQEVTYLQSAGSVRLNGRLYCTENPPYSPAKIGETLIISGYYEAWNPGNIGTSADTVYRAQNGHVVSFSHGSDVEYGPSLEDLRRFASDHEPQQL